MASLYDRQPRQPTERYAMVVGRCIYCGAREGSVELSDEHVLPFALGGHRVLPRSSCNDCAEIIKRMEGKIARDMLGVARAQLGIQTRRPKERKYETTIEFKTARERKDLVVPIKDIPALFFLPEYPPPGILVGREHENGISLKGGVVCGRGSTKKLRERLGPGIIGQTVGSYPQTFARVLAKIAHGLAVAKHDGKLEYFLPCIILGTSSEVGYYVGNEGSSIFVPEPRPLHMTSYGRTKSDNLFLVGIRLFAFHELSLTYTVVAGRFLE